jgi:hypothetical protein
MFTTINKKTSLSTLLPDNKNLKKIDPIILNEDQEKIVTSIIENRDEQNIINSIEGAAGTGKSTCTGTLIKRLREISRYETIGIIAPTHQALKVIKTMVYKALYEIDNESDNYDFDQLTADNIYFKTLHSFLGLKMVIDDNGNEQFQSGADPYADIISVDYLFVDESSMVEKEMVLKLVDLFNSRIYKQIIFIGDRYQLKPVKGEMNPIFTTSHSNIKLYKLQNVVRQQEDSNIIKFAQWLVKCIDDPDEFDINTLNTYFSTAHNDIAIYDDMIPFLEAYFNIKSEKESISDKIVGCYTNASVTQFNDFIRYSLLKDEYPEGIPYYVVNDKLIFLQPYEVGGSIQYNNGDIVRITDISYKSDYKKELYYYLCKDEEGQLFKILDHRYLPVLQNQLNVLSELAKKTTGKTRTNHWQSFFKLKNKFAKVRPVFANTLHKLQGSTYKEVFINADELIPFLNRDFDNTLRLIYVAITRGKKLHILKNKF